MATIVLAPDPGRHRSANVRREIPPPWPVLRPLLVACLVAAAALVGLSAGPADATATAPDADLVVCLDAGCSESRVLDGASVGQSRFGIRWLGSASSVRFSVDGGSWQTERIAPFDAYGTLAGDATGFRDHSLGDHSIRVIVDGGPTLTAGFTVDAADPGPDPGADCTRVVATGGDDAAPGTADRPYRTIEHGIEQLTPGDTLCIRAGRYRAAAIRNLDGTADQPITIRGYGDERPVLDRHLTYAHSACDPARSSVHSDCAVLLVDGSSHLRIHGLELTDDDPRIAGDRVNNLDLPRGPVDDTDITPGSDLAYVVVRSAHVGLRFSGGTSHLDLSNLLIHHVAATGLSGGTDDSVLTDIEIHRTGKYGTYVTGDRNRLERLHVHHTTGHGLRVANSSERFDDGVIARNRVHDIGLGDYHHRSSNVVKSGGSGLVVWWGTGNDIHYNLVNDVTNNGIVIKGCGTELVNNTVAFTDRSLIQTSSAGSSCASNRIATNLLFAGDPVRKRSVDRFDGDNIQRDVVVDSVRRDFRLPAGSPAIDAGPSGRVGELSRDIDNRPIRGRADAGAHEYQG